MRNLFYILLYFLIPFSSLYSFEYGTIIVETGLGAVRGYSNGFSWQFLGIPYAQPPIDDLRWSDPIPVLPWDGILDGSKHPPGCPQDCILPHGSCPSCISEDCLFLNIYTPLEWSSQSFESYDVMIFIHGGSFTSGGAGCQLYDGRYLANLTKTIVVTINYRLGALGFLYLKNTGINGNIGIKDQRLSFEWVSKYIPRFGGDKYSINLFGQSAGAMSIGVHLVSSESRSLFKSVIIQSNPWSIPFNSIGQAAVIGDHFLNSIHCTHEEAIEIINCLNEKTWVEIIEAQESSNFLGTNHMMNVLTSPLRWAPLIDGIQLYEDPFILIREARFTQVPIIIGTTNDEGRFFVYSLFKKEMSIADFEIFVTASFGAHNVHVIKGLYSIPDHLSDYRTHIADIVGDYLFYCPTLNITKSISVIYGDDFFKRIWLYVWEHPASFQAWGFRFPFCEKHACHGIELPFIFSSAELAGYTFSTDEYSLVREIIFLWSNMAKYSDPSGFNEVIWPNFNASFSRLIIPSSKMKISTEYRNKFCTFWDNYGY